MEDLIEAIQRDDGMGPIKFNLTSLRIENKYWEEKGGPESLQGCIVQRSTESLSDVFRLYESERKSESR